MSDFSLSLSRYLQLFDVDRFKLEAAYAKNALFSCRIHHIQEPSFSMAGLFAPESRSRQGYNVSREYIYYLLFRRLSHKSPMHRYQLLKKVEPRS